MLRYRTEHDNKKLSWCSGTCVLMVTRGGNGKLQRNPLPIKSKTLWHDKKEEQFKQEPSTYLWDWNALQQGKQKTKKIKLIQAQKQPWNKKVAQRRKKKVRDLEWKIEESGWMMDDGRWRMNEWWVMNRIYEEGVGVA